MPVYRVDWPFIRDNLLLIPPAPGEEWEIIALPVGGRQILSSVIGDRLHWQATYRTGEYDYSDWDLLRAIGDAVYAGLGDGIMLQDLLDKLDILDANTDEVESLLSALRDCSCNIAPGVDYNFVGEDVVSPPDNITPGVGDVPTAFENNPLADYDSSGTVDWDDYSVYLCDAAQRWAAAMTEVLQFMRFVTTVDAFAFTRDYLLGGVLAKLLPGQVDDAIILAWSTMYDLVDAFGAWLTGVPSSAEWDAIMVAWDGTIKNRVICHVAKAVDADTAAADIRNDMQSLYDGVLWDSFWTLYPFARIMRRVMAGAQPYEGPIAECICLLPAGWAMEKLTINEVVNVQAIQNIVIHDGGDWASWDNVGTQTPKVSYRFDVPQLVLDDEATLRGIYCKLHMTRSTNMSLETVGHGGVNYTNVFGNIYQPGAGEVTFHGLFYSDDPTLQPAVPVEAKDTELAPTGNWERMYQPTGPPYDQKNAQGFTHSAYTGDCVMHRAEFWCLMYLGVE